MVDNIKLNPASPLLSSTERVKRVDRRPHNEHQSPFKRNPQGKRKKKKNNKHGGKPAVPEADAAAGERRNAEQVIAPDLDRKQKSPAGQNKKIIDIRV